MSRTYLKDYIESYEHVRLRRDDGVLEMRLHTNGGSLVWGDGPHTELGSCFEDVGRDPENRVVILTGADQRFISAVDESWVGPMSPRKWDKIYFNGKRLLTNLLAIEVPVIAAVNGPARVHAELAVLSDITLAADSADFQDIAHFRNGIVPGDGASAIWQLLLGPNRGRYFMLTGQRISADLALELGVVNEVLPDDKLLNRAWEIARQLAQHSDTTLRYTRVVMTQTLKEMLLHQLGPGLALEGLNAYETWPTESRSR